MRGRVAIILGTLGSIVPKSPALELQLSGLVSRVHESVKSLLIQLLLRDQTRAVSLI